MTDGRREISLRAVLPFDCGHAFATDGGGRLVVSPGHVRCRVTLGEVIRTTGNDPNSESLAATDAPVPQSVDDLPEEWVWVACRVDLPCRSGVVFRSERWLRGDVFFYSTLLGDYGFPRDRVADLPLLAEAGHASELRSDLGPFYSQTPEGWRACVRYAREGSVYDLRLDARHAELSDRLLIDARPDDSPGSALPGVLAASELGACCALWYAWLLPFCGTQQPATFVRTEEYGPPEPLVEFIPETRSAQAPRRSEGNGSPE